MSITRELAGEILRAAQRMSDGEWNKYIYGLVAEPAEQPRDNDLDAFWCHVAKADFAKNTVTVEMCGNEWFVSAGNWRLIPPADAMAAERKRRQG